MLKNLLFFLLLFNTHIFICAQNETDALHAFKTGNYEQAVKMYANLYIKKGSLKYKNMAYKCKECNNSAKAGYDAINQGNYAEAVDFLNRVISLNPDDNKASEKLKQIKPWVDNKCLMGSQIFTISEGVFLAVLPIPENQIKCNRDEARDESIKCQHGGLMDWRIPTMEEMKIILREIPSDQLGGEFFWFGDFDRVCRIYRNPRTNAIERKEYIQYNATCMDKYGKYIRTEQPTFLANYFLVRDFDIDCIQCPRTVYKETR